MTMWSHAELREVYRKHGWREADFLTPARAAQQRTSSNSSGEYNSFCFSQFSPGPFSLLSSVEGILQVLMICWHHNTVVSLEFEMITGALFIGWHVS